MITIPLHPYQQEATQAVQDAYYMQDRRRIVVCSPTGSGKTRIGIACLNDLLHRSERALFLTPFIDLVEQTQKSFLEWYAPQDIGVIQGERYNQLGRWITIASKDTLDKPARLDMLMRDARRPFAIAIIDECHLSVAEGYKTLLASITSPETLVLGFSATPYREDRQSLLKVFPDGLVYNADMFDLIAQGYLANLKVYNRPTTFELSDMELAGVYTDAEAMSESLQKRLEQSNRYEIGYSTWKQLGRGKRTVFFAQNTKDAYGWEKYLTEKGVPCVVVTGKTPPWKRRDIYYPALARNELVIIFYNVGTTGLDIPSIECIVLARNTDNRGLITQIIGRGTRLCQEIGKDSFMVINLTGKNFLLYSHDFLIGKVDDEVIDVKQALQEKLDEKKKPKKHEDDESEGEDEKKVYEIGVRIKELQVSAYNAFTGTGWKGDLLSGSYTKSCGSYGTLVAERTFTGYSLIHLSPTGRKTTLSQQDLSAEHAMARGTSHIERLKEREKMNDGTSSNLKLPITQGQMRMLTNRRVLIAPPETPLKQSDYKALERLLKEHGSAFPTVDGVKCRIAHYYGQNKLLTNNTRIGDEKKHA